MLSLPYAVALAALSAMIGGAVTWGMLRATVSQLSETVAELRSETKEMRELINELHIELVAMRTQISSDKETWMGRGQEIERRVGSLEANARGDTGKHKPAR